jgi:hypothetical protein
MMNGHDPLLIGLLLSVLAVAAGVAYCRWPALGPALDIASKTVLVFICTMIFIGSGGTNQSNRTVAPSAPLPTPTPAMPFSPPSEAMEREPVLRG